MTTAGATPCTFSVRYFDDGPIDQGSLDDDDVRVTGPGGLSAGATFVGVDDASSASNVIACYRIVPPGGSWDAADNGNYIIVMQPLQVIDMPRNPVRPGAIGQFNVSISGPPPPTAQPLNVSTRLRGQTGEGVMIGGFIITGSVPQQVVMRAIGPTLTQFGINGALSDPVVSFFSGQTLLMSNDDWEIRPACPKTRMLPGASCAMWRRCSKTSPT